MNTLHGKRVVVLGATGLVGMVLTETLLALGAKVIAGARRRTRLDELRSGLADHDNLQVAEVDTTVPEGIEGFARDVLRNGPLDGLVNATGFFQGGPAWQIDESDTRALLDANVLGSALSLRAFVPAMIQQGRGSIVLIAADTALRPEAELGLYGATKAATAHLMTASARELLGSGVRVNGLFPGAIANASQVTGIAPLELCKAAAWLLSDASQYVSGSAIGFDGTRDS